MVIWGGFFRLSTPATQLEKYHQTIINESAQTSKYLPKILIYNFFTLFHKVQASAFIKGHPAAGRRKPPYLRSAGTLWQRTTSSAVGHRRSVIIVIFSSPFLHPNLGWHVLFFTCPLNALRLLLLVLYWLAKRWFCCLFAFLNWAKNYLWDTYNNIFGQQKNPRAAIV